MSYYSAPLHHQTTASTLQHHVRSSVFNSSLSTKTKSRKASGATSVSSGASTLVTNDRSPTQVPSKSYTSRVALTYHRYDHSRVESEPLNHVACGKNRIHYFIPFRYAYVIKRDKAQCPLQSPQMQRKNARSCQSISHCSPSSPSSSHLFSSRSFPARPPAPSSSLGAPPTARSSFSSCWLP